MCVCVTMKISFSQNRSTNQTQRRVCVSTFVTMNRNQNSLSFCNEAAWDEAPCVRTLQCRKTSNEAWWFGGSVFPPCSGQTSQALNTAAVNVHGGRHQVNGFYRFDLMLMKLKQRGFQLLLKRPDSYGQRRAEGHIWSGRLEVHFCSAWRLKGRAGVLVCFSSFRGFSDTENKNLPAAARTLYVSRHIVSFCSQQPFYIRQLINWSAFPLFFKGQCHRLSTSLKYLPASSSRHLLMTSSGGGCRLTSYGTSSQVTS